MGNYTYIRNLHIAEKHSHPGKQKKLSNPCKTENYT